MTQIILTDRDHYFKRGLIGLSGNAKQRRKQIRLFRKQGFLVRLY